MFVPNPPSSSPVFLPAVLPAQRSPSESDLAGTPQVARNSEFSLNYLIALKGVMGERLEVCVGLRRLMGTLHTPLLGIIHFVGTRWAGTVGTLHQSGMSELWY